MSGYRFCVNVVTASFLAAAGSAGWLGLVATAAADPGGSGSSHDSGGSHSSAAGPHSPGSSRPGGSGASGSAGAGSGHESKTPRAAGNSPTQHGGVAQGGHTGTKSSGGTDAPGHSTATKPKAPPSPHSADSPSTATKDAAAGGVPTKEKRALTDPKPGTRDTAQASGASGGGVGPEADHKPGGKPASTPPGHAAKTGENGSNTLRPKHVEGHKEGEHSGAKGEQRPSPSTNGEWKSHSGGASLNSEQNAAADKFLEQARRAEPRITQSLRGIVDNAPGSQLTGLGKRLKTEESFKRKLYTSIVTTPNLSTAEHLSDMKDSVRYTVQSPHELYTANTQQAIDRLVAQGYEPVKFKNTWDKPGYQGINSFWREPTTGHTFEVQFHTPASFDTKTQAHSLYEEERLPDTSPQRANELQQKLNHVFDSVPRPSGSSSISLPPNGKRK
ncbi:hypothetical protein [Mycobacteroides chelonae]|uniref:hypothetical protein n=1 Tax=Mycobacteroides chelonae TaxID=1774 RepID=UPI0019102516|nr:hypothetical protein [Mycobacteroides chelonae]